MDTLFLFIYENLLAFSLLIVCLAALIIYESKKGGTKLDPTQATRLINKDGAVVIDLRTQEEFSNGHIAGSINISPDLVEQQLNSLKHPKEKPLILICKTGNSSKGTGDMLVKRGYMYVNRISGGMVTWQGIGLPLSR